MKAKQPITAVILVTKVTHAHTRFSFNCPFFWSYSRLSQYLKVNFRELLWQAGCPTWQQLTASKHWRTIRNDVNWHNTWMTASLTTYQVNPSRPTTTVYLSSQNCLLEVWPFVETWATLNCWWRSTVVRPPVLASELSLSCARLTAGRVTTLWVKRPISVNQHGQLSLPFLRGRLNE